MEHNRVWVTFPVHDLLQNYISFFEIPENSPANSMNQAAIRIVYAHFRADPGE
jgi:hypothetical protein